MSNVIDIKHLFDKGVSFSVPAYELGALPMMMSPLVTIGVLKDIGHDQVKAGSFGDIVTLEQLDIMEFILTGYVPHTSVKTGVLVIEAVVKQPHSLARGVKTFFAKSVDGRLEECLTVDVAFTDVDPDFKVDTGMVLDINRVAASEDDGIGSRPVRHFIGRMNALVGAMTGRGFLSDGCYCALIPYSDNSAVSITLCQEGGIHLSD